jgi:hypothetical protein
MKISKIFLMAGLIMMSFMATSCGSNDDWAPGDPSLVGGQNVYLNTAENIELPMDGNTFEVTFARTTTSGELTIPVNFSTPTPEVFTDVPKTVTFASGADKATITITCKSDMEVLRTYRATITIDQQYTQAYIDNETNCPKAELKVIKVDYKPFKNGTYYSEFFGTEEPAVLEYSEIKKLYRFKHVAADQTFNFTVDADNNIKVVEAKIPTSYVHATYGAVTANRTNKPSYIEVEDGVTTYYFNFEYTVSAGSFGDAYDYFVVNP